MCNFRNEIARPRLLYSQALIEYWDFCFIVITFVAAKLMVTVSVIKVKRQTLISALQG